MITMLTCKETTQLASKKIDQALTFRERMGFFLHICLCRLCRRYAADIERLHQLMQTTDSSVDAFLSKQTQLPEKARRRIQQAIDNRLKTKQ